jgi:cytochrome bd-type quinol oxidase subunit 2
MTRTIINEILPAAENLAEAVLCQEAGTICQKAPLKPLLILSYLLFLCVHISVLCQGFCSLLYTSAQPLAHTSSQQLFSLILVKLCTVASLSYLTFCNLTRRLTHAQLADWNLMYLAVIIPLANLNFYFNLSTFDVTTQQWPLFFIFLMTLGVCVSELPTKHCILQYLMTAPALM